MYICEYLLAYEQASETTATLFEVIITLSSQIMFCTDVWQGFQHSCYTVLKAIVTEKISSHVFYVHYYAQSLNLVLISFMWRQQI